MKILMTGVSGFLGQNLVRFLLDKDFDIHVVVRKNSNTSFLNKKIKIFVYDNDDIDSLIKYFKVNKFDGVIHLASLFLANHQSQDISSLISSNIKFGTEILEASKISKVSWFINTGTFWQNYENEDYNPVNLYAATKEAFEKIAFYFTQTSDMIFTTIKLNDTFGPNDTRNKIFNLWLNALKTKEEIAMSKGEQIIDISFIDDIVEAYYVLINHLSSENKDKFRNKTFAIKSDTRVTLKELSKIFEKVVNCKLNIIWGKKEYREREIMEPWNKGEAIPEFKAKYSLEKAIKKTLEEINE